MISHSSVVVLADTLDRETQDTYLLDIEVTDGTKKVVYNINPILKR